VFGFAAGDVLLTDVGGVLFEIRGGAHTPKNHWPPARHQEEVKLFCGSSLKASVFCSRRRRWC
jgi:hypothetical protein